MIGLEVDPRLANKANKRKRAELYEKKGKVARKDPSKRVKLTLEQESVQKICLFETYSHKKFYSFVMNEAKLTAEQRSRLWHWRLGHPSHSTHYFMNKRGNIKDLGSCKCLNEDCVVCDKSKFESASFKADTDDLSGKKTALPMQRIYIDGFGGQNSFGVPSYHGAVGGFIFVDTCHSRLDIKMYTVSYTHLTLPTKRIV